MIFNEVKSFHPLMNWDCSMFEEFAPITITIEMPDVKQTKLDEY